MPINTRLPNALSGLVKAAPVTGACAAALQVANLGHGITVEFRPVVCAAIESKTSPANLYMAFRWFSRAYDMVKSNFDGSGATSAATCTTDLSVLRPVGIVTDKLTAKVCELSSNPAYTNSGPSTEAVKFLGVARDLFAQAYEARKAQPWSSSVDGPAGQITEETCLQKLRTPPAPEANDAVMSEYDRAFVCGLLSWPGTTDQELSYAISIWSLRNWTTAVQLAKAEQDRRKAAGGTGGTGGIDVGGLKIPGIDDVIDGKTPDPVEDNMPAPKVATITAAQVPNPLTPEFCMANADDGLIGEAATSRCKALIDPSTPVEALGLMAANLSVLAPNVATMASVQVSRRTTAKEPNEEMPEPVCLPNGTPSALADLCCSKHLEGGKCADIPKQPEKKTSPWLIGSLIVAGVGVVGLGAWAVMRKPTGEHLSNPAKPRPQSGYAYEYDGKYWKTGPNDDWDTVMYTPTGDEQHVGVRTIDGSRCNVWRTSDGFIAQSVAMTGGA